MTQDLTAATCPHIELDPAALVANWRFLADLAVGAECAAVVKADAYGIGADVAVPALAGAGCRSFFVAHLHEGQLVRQIAGPDARVFVLSGLLPGQGETFAQAGLVPVLGALDQIEAWRNEAPTSPMALHVDTGMNRLGLPPDDVDAAADLMEGLEPVLVMSHLACASDPDHPKNALQRRAFIEAAARLPAAPLSLSASAGTLMGPDWHFDMVRPGIALYGGGPLDAAHVPLRPVVRLTACVLQVRDVGPGDTIGYGATWEADRRRRVAVVALGYADGFLRSGSSRGFAVAGGAVLHVLGRVSMDLVALDATQAPKLKAGDHVEFLGPAAPIDAQAQACDTIPYELLTGLSRRATRTVRPGSDAG
jgi:alanine racemase